MKIGIIGSGNIRTAVGKKIVVAGHEVIISISRGPGSFKGIIRIL